MTRRSGGSGKHGASRSRLTAPCSLLVHVQPRAKRTEVAGWLGDAIKIRLKAPPVDGAANAELIDFLADRLNLPRDRIRLAVGAAGRRKRIEIEGVERPELLVRLGLEPRAGSRGEDPPAR